MNNPQLRRDALAIWQAGVDAVKPARLFQQKLSVEKQRLHIAGLAVDLRQTRRLVVVGAGKASAEMALAFEKLIYPDLLADNPSLELTGWINCPEGSFPPDEATSGIRLFEARPAGRNEPTEKAVYGTERILDMLRDCDQNDLVICLLSGGGSALLTAPISGVSLSDKQAVARLVAAAGGNIVQLNAIRRALSRVKAGGLARACHAPQMVTLVLSDVLGDSLETIASGPTFTQTVASGEEALQALRDLSLLDRPELTNVVRSLQEHQQIGQAPATCSVEHVILGSNADAVVHAEHKARDLGYKCRSESAKHAEGNVEPVAAQIFKTLRPVLSLDARDSKAEFSCYISGGEPTVELPEQPGLGGRNQLLALLLMRELRASGWPSNNMNNLAFVSGGTDGEDGPTDAAGAFFDVELAKKATELNLDLDDYILRADPYRFFEALGGLIKIGASGTNVCDLRIAVTASD